MFGNDWEGERMASDTEHVSVIINGKEVELNRFVKSIIASTALGMVSALKHEDAIHRIEIKVQVPKN
jgi:hypothetical protein